MHSLVLDLPISSKFHPFSFEHMTPSFGPSEIVNMNFSSNNHTTPKIKIEVFLSIEVKRKPHSLVLERNLCATRPKHLPLSSQAGFYLDLVEHNAVQDIQ